MLFSFIIPRIILVNLGSDTNGLLASLGQFFVYFDLFSAGIGSATILSLYKHLKTNDQKSISEVLSASRLYYRKASRYYLLCVVILLIIFPMIVKTDIPVFTIVSIILLQGIAGYISFVYMRSIICLLNAEGKDYIVTSIGFIIQLLTSIGKIFILVVFKDIILLQAYILVIIIIQSLIYYIYKKRKYNWIEFSKEPNLLHLSQRNSLVVHQITSLVFLSSGSIILSLFTDLKTVSVYAIFMLITNLLRNLLASFYSSTAFLFGQIYQEGKDKYVKFNDIYHILNVTLVSTLFSVTYVLFIPFIRLYTSGVSDVNYIEPVLPVFFCLISMLYLSRTANYNTIMVAGHAKQTVMHSLIEMAINLVLSIALVQLIGIYGVLIGTLASLFYRANNMIIYTNLKIFKRKPWKEYKVWISNFLLFGIIVIFSAFIDLKIVDYLDFLMCGTILSVLFIFFFFGISYLINRNEYKTIYKLVYSPILLKYRNKKFFT